MSYRTPPTFLLVPGAWHRPWSFDLLRDDLHGRGLSTETVTLAGVGSTDANVGLEQDTAAVRTELQKLVDDGREVVVVAHSYGGVPTANAVEGLNYKDRVAQSKTGGVLMVVYMASFAIGAGSALSDGAGSVPWWDVKVGQPSHAGSGKLATLAHHSRFVGRLHLTSRSDLRILRRCRARSRRQGRRGPTSSAFQDLPRQVRLRTLE